MRRTHLTQLCLALSVTVALVLATGPGSAIADPPGSPVADSAGSTTGRVTEAAPDRGTWRVLARGGRSFEVSWTSPQRLPVTDARPEVVRDGVPVGTSTVARNGRTVSVTMVSDVPPRTDDLGVVLSGRRLDEPALPQDDQVPEARFSAPAAVPTLDVDPGVPGDDEVTTSDYRLPGYQAVGMPRLIEVVGHVVRPAGQLAEDAPLVMFLHGRHEFCYDPTNPDRYAYSWPCPQGMEPIPSQLGYDYVQRLLASQGYITVSIAANGINAQDDARFDGGAQARAGLIRRHLRQWVTWVGEGKYQADMHKVILVGHSRGGEGVNRASLETPLQASYRIAGQILLAPTNFARQTTAFVPTVTVLPYCDGDVSDLQGQSYTDRARDLTHDDASLKSSLLVMGANHNFFNTEWTPGISAAPSFDDFSGPPDETCGKQTAARLSAAEQRDVGKTYIAGAVHLMSGADPGTLPMFDGTAGQVASAGDADVRSQAIGGGRVLRRPGVDSRVAPAVLAVTQVCTGHVGTRRANACGRASTQEKDPHWVPATPAGIPTSPAFEMSWNAVGQRGGLVFDTPLDASTADSLDLRTVVDPTMGNVRVDVRLVDADGNATTVTPLAQGFVPALPRGSAYFLGKLLAQTVRVPMDRVSGIDPQHITELDLVGTSDNGHVWVLDTAAVPPGELPPVLDKRLPRVNLGKVRQVEGDARGTSIAHVPFTLSPPASEAGRFVVTLWDPYGGRRIAPLRVDVAAGQSAGSIPVAYQANRIDDLNQRTFMLTAYPLRNLMVRDSSGLARILDDDPAPRLTIRRTPPRQVEGRPVTWSVRLSEPVGYDFFVEATAIAAPSVPGPRLTLGDLTRRFVVRQGLGGADPRTSLRKARIWVYALVRPGETFAELRLPTRRDRVKERTESVTMRIRVRHLGVRKVLTSYLKDAR